MRVTNISLSTTAFLIIILAIMLAMILETTIHSHSEPTDCSFRIYVVDSSVEVFDNNTFVGRVELQGQLDSLMTDYLQ